MSETSAIQDLWSRADEAAQRALVAAVRTSDLVPALLAIEGAAPEAAVRVREQLDAWADGVLERIAGGEGAVEAMIEVLGVGAALEGDTDDYYRPDNSHLSSVIARRRGLPIALSSIWIAVGRAANVDVEGVALPGHFVARVEETIVDPFQAGIRLTVEDCRRIVESFGAPGAWDPSWLEGAPVETIAIRVLRNLANAYHSNDQRAALYRVVRMLAALAPTEASVQLDLAQLTEEMGAYGLASDLYDTIATGFDGTREARIAAIRAIELESLAPTTH